MPCEDELTSGEVRKPPLAELQSFASCSRDHVQGLSFCRIGVSLSFFIIISSVTFLPYALYAQEAGAPVYKDGDWWRIEVKVSQRKDLSRSADCSETYSEYIVKIDQGQAKVYGIRETPEEIDCPKILLELLGLSKPGIEGQSPQVDESQIHYLKFPLSIGQSWTSRISEVRGGRGKVKDRPISLEHNVLSWEKVSTLKGELEALKIEVSRKGESNVTYYYSPKAKAILLFQSRLLQTRRTVTMVDFNISE